MASAIRFYLDQNVNPAIARGLVRRGVDVLTTQAAGRCSRSDEEQLEFARRTRRLIVTQDEDFLVLHAAGVPHAGRVYAKKGSRTVGEMILFLCLLHQAVSAEEMRGRLEFA